MQEIPLFVLLIPYFFVFLFFTAFYAVNIYHIIGTGVYTKATLAIMIFIFCAVVTVLFFSWYFLRGIDWFVPLFDMNIENQAGSNNGF